MTEENLNLLKSQLPISLNITSSMDYPNGMVADSVKFTRPDNSVGIMAIEPEYSTFARITGTLGPFAIVLTWNYEDDPDNIRVDYTGLKDGGDKKIPITELKQFLIKLKG
jgi:hypothetical protein